MKSISELKATKIVVWIIDYSPNILMGVGPIGLCLSGLFLKTSGWTNRNIVIFSVSAIAVILGNLLIINRNNRLRKLLLEIESLTSENKTLQLEIAQNEDDYFDLLNKQLSVLFSMLEFTENERISLYKHEADKFVMLGRFSTNPIFCRKSRTIYPDNQGCLKKAWEQGNSFVNDLPDPIQYKKRYYKILKASWDIDEDTAQNFTMKSRTLLALGINHVSGFPRIAVIVFESILENGLNEDLLKNIFEVAEHKRMAIFLDKLRDKEPNLALAKREGF
jgi:hypothetical protein